MKGLGEIVEERRLQQPQTGDTKRVDSEKEPTDENGEMRKILPDTTVTSFSIDRRFARFAQAVFCFGLAFVLLTVPIPSIDQPAIIVLTGTPMFAVLFIGWYVGRPLMAAYKQLTYDYTPVDPDHLPSITVMIPAYNEEETIANTITNVFSQTYPIPVEVVVCNDGSSDDTWSILQFMDTVYERLTIVQHENSGLPATRNHALEHATNDIILSMDADTVLKDNALYEAGTAFVRNPDAVAVGTNVGVLNPTESVWTKMQVYNYLLSMELSRMYQYGLGYVLVLSGGCSVYKREVLEAAGGWNEQLEAEDYDMTVRVHEYGPIVYSPVIHAYTDVPTTFRDLWRQRFRWRHGGMTTTLVHSDKSGSRAYGMLGVVGLPLKLALGALVFWSIGTTIFSILNGQLQFSVVFVQAFIVTTVITTGLSAFMIGITIVFCRDRKSLDVPGALPLYLAVYRWFHLTVRFIGSIYGIYNYLRYLRGNNVNTASN